MFDIESVNPWYWTDGQDNWTPSILKAMVMDLKNCGVDRLFEECFDLYSDFSTALAEQTAAEGMEYECGNDPMHIYQVAWNQAQTATDFPTLYEPTTPISMYNYRLLRDTYFENAQLYQHAALAYGFAKTWNKPTAMVYSMGFDWGIDNASRPGMFRSTALVSALQFGMDDFLLIRSTYSQLSDLDIPSFKVWMDGYIQKQETVSKPVLNIVIHLDIPFDKHNWMGLLVQGDAITWGAFQAGYDIKCSVDPLPGADAYYIVTRGYEYGGGTLDLTSSMADLFDGDKPVLLQCLYGLPNGTLLTSNWARALDAVGIDASHGGVYHGDMPSTGTFDGQSFNFTGYDTREKWWRTNIGTRMEPSCVAASEICAADGDLPLIVGRNRKYFIAGSCLSWQAGAVISRLLSGYGTSPQSNVWGVAGPEVAAVIAIDDTELDIDIPQLGEGNTIHVVQYDRYYNTKYEETVTYTPLYTRSMSRYDTIVIDTVNRVEPQSPPYIPGSGSGGGGVSNSSTYIKCGSVQFVPVFAMFFPSIASLAKPVGELRLG